MSSNISSTIKATLAKPTSFFGLPLWILLLASTAALVALMTCVALCICLIYYRHHRKPYKSPFSLPEPITSKYCRRRRDFSSSSLDKRLLSGNNIVAGTQMNFDIEEDGYLRDLESIGYGAKKVLGQNREFCMEEIEEATNGLAKENLIGSGDHGIVYLGLLPDNTRVAVKKLVIDSCQTEDFALQMEAIRHVKHKKLVKLLGYCTEGGYRVSVSEHVDNGNLHQWLNEYPGQVSPLTWDIRLKIIQGVAKGLAYLHEDVEPKILHGSLTSTNVLLDSQWNPKISDFGLAKLFTAEWILNNMDTMGYVSPDCYASSIFSESNDIYSFGILIMEIISGRIPFDHSQPQAHLIDWFKTMIANENIDCLVDSKLPEKPPSKELKRMILVSLLCVDSDENPKLKMGDVIHMLEPHDLLLSDVRENC